MARRKKNNWLLMALLAIGALAVGMYKSDWLKAKVDEVKNKVQ